METNYQFIKRITKIILFIFAIGMLLALVSSVNALSVSVINVSGDYAFFQATGSTGTIGQFRWGSFQSGPYYWSTPNQTFNGGTFTDFQYGPPMMTNSTYWVVACDNVVGCSASVSFTTPAAVLPPQTAFGLPLLQLMHNGFDVGDLLNDIVAPYAQPIFSPSGGVALSASMIWGSLFFFIFVGLWLKPKDILIPCILAFIAGGFIMTSAYGVPVQFQQVGQGLMYASVAGIVLSWFIK